MYESQIKTRIILAVPPSMELNVFLRRVMTRSIVRLSASVVGISLIVYAGTLLPGLFLLLLPGMVALAGKVYDEANLIKFLRYGEPMIMGHLEDTETSTERVRIRSSENRNISMTF